MGIVECLVCGSPETGSCRDIFPSVVQAQVGPAGGLAIPRASWAGLGSLRGPQCKRCRAYGVFCNYDGRCSDLQLSFEWAANINTSTKLALLAEQERGQTWRVMPSR